MDKLINMEKRENEPKNVKAVRVGCMDENDRPGSKVAKVGVAGSGVTVSKGGNESVYPLDERENMSEAVIYILEWVSKFSEKFGVSPNISSHPECAAVGAQGKSSENDLIKVTKDFSKVHEIEYAEHLGISMLPGKLHNEAASWFNRGKGKSHKASGINITVGGAITGAEKDKLEKESGGSAFDISMDWVNHALNRGFSKDKIVKALLFQLKLAYSISENVRNNKDPFNIFDGGRLDYNVVDENIRVVKEAIGIARNEISQGNWKAASHH